MRPHLLDPILADYPIAAQLAGLALTETSLAALAPAVPSLAELRLAELRLAEQNLAADLGTANFAAVTLALRQRNLGDTVRRKTDLKRGHFGLGRCNRTRHKIDVKR